MRVVGTLGFALLVASSVAEAQTSSIAGPTLPSTDVPTQCELHVWPAERLEGLAFRLYNGLIQGRASTDQIEGAMDDLVSPSVQVAALRDANVVSELGLPEHTRIIEHQEPLENKSLNKIRTRRAQSSSPCYAELIMMNHLLIEDIVWGDRFLSSFMFRNYGNRADATNSVKGRGGNKLKVLTQTDASRPADAAQLVAAALRANFLEFTKSARPKLGATSATGH